MTPIRKPISWVQLVLAVASIATAIGIAVGFLEISASGAEIRAESAEVLELHHLVAALGQIRQVGATVAEERAILDPPALNPASGLTVFDDPVRAFGAAYRRLGSVSDDADRVDELGAAWRDYLLVLDGFADAGFGPPVIDYYHRVVLPAQASVETALIGFQLSEGEQLQAAIAGSAQADTWLRTLLPVLVGLALLLAASIIWLQRQRRRHERDRLIAQNREKDALVTSYEPR